MDTLNVLPGWEIEEIELYGLKGKTWGNRPHDLVQILEDTVARYPDVEGFIEDDLRLTFAEFNAIVNRIAAGLQRFGVKQGDRVALLLGIQIDFPLCFFALMKLGAIAVPLNTRFKDQELAYEINNSESSLLILDEDYWTSLKPAIDQLQSVRKIFYSGAQPPKGTLSITELTENSSDNFTPARLSESDEALILFTSGTTGRPKGAVLHQHGLVITAMTTSAFLQLSPGDKMICCVPLFHATGLSMSMLSHIFSGVPGVYLKNFKTEHVLEVFAAEKVTHYIGVVNIIWLMINHANFGQRDYSFFKRAMVGGSPVTEEMVNRVKSKLPNLLMSVGYGLTESHALVTTTPWHDAIRKIKAVGQMLWPTEVKIVDEEGQELSIGETGEILLRGVKMFKSYWKNKTATQTSYVDGWLYTGDIGKVDEEGFLYILDRKKDMINRGGEKIYSQEVENLIFNYPKVLEVAVVGVPDKVMGEAVKAVIVVKEGEKATQEEIHAFCAEHLADFKVPKYIEFIESLPRNPAGKLIKSELRYAPPDR